VSIAGRSGAGKSYLLERLIRQDIQRHRGFAIFDLAGGALADSVFRYLAERATTDNAVYDRIRILDLSAGGCSDLLRPIPGVRGAVLVKHLARAMLPTGQSEPRARLLRAALNSLYRRGRLFKDLALALRDPRIGRSLRRSGARGHGRDREEAAVRASLLASLRPLLGIARSRLATDPPVLLDFEEAARHRSWLIARATSAVERKLAELILVRLALAARSRANRQRERLFTIYVDGADGIRSGIQRLARLCRRSRVGLVSAHRSSDGVWVHGPGVKLMMGMPGRHARGLPGASSARFTRLLETFDRGEMLVYARGWAAEIITVPSHAPARPSLAELARLDAAIHDRKCRPVHASSVTEAPPEPSEAENASMCAA
jgi:hypothetical protein